MSKIVAPLLIIDGSTFLPKSGYSVTIEHAMGTHSSFRVVFQASATEGYNGALMDNSLKFAGKRISIGLDDGAMRPFTTTARAFRKYGSPNSSYAMPRKITNAGANS